MLAELMTLAAAPDEKMVLAPWPGSATSAGGGYRRLLADKDRGRGGRGGRQDRQDVRVTGRTPPKAVIKSSKCADANRATGSRRCVGHGPEHRPQGLPSRTTWTGRRAGGDQTAIDGDLGTYWDERNSPSSPAGRYLQTAGRSPPWRHRLHHSFARGFRIICEEVVKKVDGAYDGWPVVGFDAVSCTSVKMRSPTVGGSPAIHG
jgi:hypothetical protein